MRHQTSLWLLVGAALATPLIAVFSGQGGDEWSRHVDKACTASRFGIRIAAARKVAAGGDAAVPAIRAFAKRHGRNDIPSSLVDALADATPAPAVQELLVEWSSDPDFYWRSTALRGLALRRDASQRSLFERHLDDPAWLSRTHARFGLQLLDPRREAGDDADPRARVRLARLLLEQGQVPDLQPLIDALADDRTFLGDPWGARLGMESNKALQRWLGDDYPTVDPDDKPGSIERIRAAAANRSGQPLRAPAPLIDHANGVVGGIELLSCKSGDRFVRWDADGTVYFGIDAGRTVQLPADAWAGLSTKPTPLALASDCGVVVCDSLRIRLDKPQTHVKVAPASLPDDATNWLKQLADALEEQSAADLAAELRRGIDQFAAR